MGWAERFRTRAWALRCWGLAALSLVAAVATLWRPAHGTVGPSKVSVQCGSILRPFPQAGAYVCEDAHSGMVLAVTLLLLLALVLFAAGYLADSAPGDGRARRVRWAIVPALYFVVVTWAALLTYPFVIESDATNGYVSGLEYLAQLLVGLPTSTLGMVASGDSYAATVVGLYVAGLIQVGVVAAVCVAGCRRSSRRSEAFTHAPVT